MYIFVSKYGLVTKKIDVKNLRKIIVTPKEDNRNCAKNNWEDNRNLNISQQNKRNRLLHNNNRRVYNIQNEQNDYQE